jgi:16S rRNA (cytidine1402-2'-O)-methyltransferase
VADETAPAAAALYLVGTPIGNLGDLTLRAIEVLRTVTHVAAEDTRRTRALLTHLGIHGKEIHRLDANAETSAAERLCQHIEHGQSVAFVTDAGMPSVSDPGALLVSRARERGIDVRCVPGPSAVTTAAALSGLVHGPFTFLGFLPRQGGKRRHALELAASSPLPVLLFESPNRLANTLADLAAFAPARQAVVCRELTKLHEETIVGAVAELAARNESWRGEITVVLAAAAPEPPPAAEIDAAIRARLHAGGTPRTVAQELSAALGQPRRALYARALALLEEIESE